MNPQPIQVVVTLPNPAANDVELACSTNNVICILGMLEMAKKKLDELKAGPPPSRLVVPTPMVGGINGH